MTTASAGARISASCDDDLGLLDDGPGAIDVEARLLLLIGAESLARQPQALFARLHSAAWARSRSVLARSRCCGVPTFFESRCSCRCQFRSRQGGGGALVGDVGFGGCNLGAAAAGLEIAIAARRRRSAACRSRSTASAVSPRSSDIEQVAGFDAVALHHLDVDHPARHLRREIDERRLDPAVQTRSARSGSVLARTPAGRARCRS